MLKPTSGNISPLTRTKSKTYTSSTGEELTTLKEDKSYPLAKNFTKVGSLFNKSSSMNILKLARHMTKGEIDFIIALFDSTKDYKTYIFDYGLSGFTHSKRNAANKAFNLLKNKGLAKRVSKAKYIINPALFIPFMENEADELWTSLP